MVVAKACVPVAQEGQAVCGGCQCLAAGTYYLLVKHHGIRFVRRGYVRIGTGSWYYSVHWWCHVVRSGHGYLRADDEAHWCVVVRRSTRGGGVRDGAGFPRCCQWCLHLRGG